MRSATAFNSLKGTSSDETVASVKPPHRSQGGRCLFAVTQRWLKRAKPCWLVRLLLGKLILYIAIWQDHLMLMQWLWYGRYVYRVISVTSKTITIHCIMTPRLNRQCRMLIMRGRRVCAHCFHSSRAKGGCESTATGDKTDMQIFHWSGILAGANAFGVVDLARQAPMERCVGVR